MSIFLAALNPNLTEEDLAKLFEMHFENQRRLFDQVKKFCEENPKYAMEHMAAVLPIIFAL
jgi:hypothetical protein